MKFFTERIVESDWISFQVPHIPEEVFKVQSYDRAIDYIYDIYERVNKELKTGEFWDH